MDQTRLVDGADIFWPINSCFGCQAFRDEEEQTTEHVEESEDAPLVAFIKRVVPVPVIVTEPAVGNGLGLAIGYFHPTAQSSARAAPPRVLNGESANDPMTSGKPPPTVTGVFGGYTANGSYLVGAGHATPFVTTRCGWLSAGESVM